MKKLMITAAALLTACVVGAATDRERASGTDFESYPLGALSLDYDEDGLSQGTYWSSDQLGESEVKEESEGGNKYLAIEESVVPLYRNMFKSNLQKQSETVDAEQSVYFSSKVKFTASEDETITPSEGDKLIVWLRATEENPTTNLIVTAGIYEDGQWGTTNYVVGQSIDVDVPHDLEIVAKMDDSVLKFEVKVDGSAVTSGETTLFPSLDQYSDYRSTITCAGFKGSGWVDDIEFGTIKENPTKYYEVDGEEYITFAEALAAAAEADDSTIKLINDAVLEYDDVAGAGFTVTNDVDLVIDLAGCTISCEGVVFANEDTLTILDTVGGGSVENTAENAENSIENYGGDVYISGGIYLGAVYNDDDSGSIVVTLNGNPAELVLDDDSESETYGYWVIQASSQPPAPTEDWVDPTDAEAMAEITGKTVAQAYPTLAASLSANLQAADAVKLTKWATGVGGVDFADAAGINETAFLLGVANDETDLTLEPASIEIVNGKVVISANKDLEDVNGKVYIKTAEDLEDLASATWAEANLDEDGAVSLNAVEDASFYKIKVDF